MGCCLWLIQLTCLLEWSRALPPDTPPLACTDIYCPWMSGTTWTQTRKNALVVFHHRMFIFTLFWHNFDVTITGHDAHRTMKSECARLMMFFSERMCSCCLVSTMCRFFRIFMAYVFTSSFFSWTWTTNQPLVITCSTRINHYTGTCNTNPSATQSSLFAIYYYDLLWILFYQRVV